ncbi:uncharacterized protein DFL_005910 [Arthrobotrys flagrans]|uniref:NAD(P)-binding domain-containing protein n=1 Tax=Arthrobotrys flagrans TaxID=97331 RepID=A0A436ZZG0_ARTFL|nr:hypothetical protein DFL_005910 [Arthrobotrys flagrans]
MTITVGIAGITGKLARVLISSLLKYPEVAIRGYCRDPSKLSSALSSNPKISLIKGDGFDTAAINTFVSGCDVVVCCYLGDGKLMVDGQKLLIDRCADNGVPRYVASDWSIDYTKLEFGQLFPKDPMKHVKAYLDAQDKVKGVHILVGGFIETFFNPLFGTWDPATTTFRFWGTGEEVWEGTTYVNAAEFTAAVCVDKDAYGILKLVGGSTTIRGLAESFEKVYGVKPKLEILGLQKELYEKMHDLRKTQPENFYSYLFLFFQYYIINGQTVIGPEYDNEKYPQVTPVTWEDFLRSVPQEQLASSNFSVGQGV